MDAPPDSDDSQIDRKVASSNQVFHHLPKGHQERYSATSDSLCKTLH